jgi:hypothetical protein
MIKRIGLIGLSLLLSGLIAACSNTGGPSGGAYASGPLPTAQAINTPVPAPVATTVSTAVPAVAQNIPPSPSQTAGPTVAPNTPLPPTQQSKKVRLPFLIGQPYEEGVRELINAGIPNYLPEDGDSSDVPLGYIYYQYPPAKTLIDPETTFVILGRNMGDSPPPSGLGCH